ncbi:nucleolar complex-associated protein 3 isoform X2 [Cryptomeria japonica]|uniref:nucleolar complex-associated protein 3 isoform X2 n=1 Tax=Cryptomeria japonica TaxID=3369 RepID=UPI0027DA7F31|nr:nucleolar complex-associated protein 3 isoform X2 [Cryptomeria japonica]
MGKKDKNSNKSQLPLLPPEEEVEVSDEDLEFIQRNTQYASFLNRLDTHTITKQVVGLLDEGNDEEALENYYEKKRLKKKEENISNLVDAVDVLPVKSLTGQLYYKTDSKGSGPFQQNNKGTSVESNVNEDVSAAKSKEKLSKAERRKELKHAKKQAKKLAKEESQLATIRKAPKSALLEELKKDLSAEELFAQRKAHLAEIGTGLLADPEKNISTLKELVEMCSDRDKSISHLATLSALAVFKDIVPGYRVRLPTEKELQMKVSKEVKKVRDFESTLLRFYQTYIQKLMTLEHDSSSCKIALRCMCCLLEAIPHFNYRDSLLAAVIPHVSSIDDSSRNLSATAVRSLFLNEGKHGGEATVEAVELIADFVKQHHCRLHPNTIEVFSSLSFDEGLGRFQESQLNSKNNRRAKEKNNDLKSSGPEKSENKVKKRQLASKLREEVEADFRAASSAPDTVERRRMQTQTIAAVFKTYFRILKCSIEPQTDRSYNPPRRELSDFGSGKHPLLVPCLDGLGRFSHLINVDFMGDLLRFLQRLASGETTSKTNSGVSSQLELTVLERLRCCIVAFKIVRSNLDALNIDLREFFVQLYNILLECKPERDSHGQALSEALQIMLCEVRQHDMQRVAAFTKRLASLSLHFGSAEAMMVLVTVKNLLQKYSKCRNLLENDGGGGSVGGTVAVPQIKNWEDSVE